MSSDEKMPQRKSSAEKKVRKKKSQGKSSSGPQESATKAAVKPKNKSREDKQTSKRQPRQQFAARTPGFAASQPGGQVTASEVDKMQAELIQLRQVVETLSSNFATELGVVKPLNPVEKLITMTAQVERVRKQQLKQTEQLYSYVKMQGLEESFALILGAEKDKVTYLNRSLDWNCYQSIAARLDASRSSIESQVSSWDFEEAERTLVSEGKVSDANSRDTLCLTHCFPDRCCPNGQSQQAKLL